MRSRRFPVVVLATLVLAAGCATGVSGDETAPPSGPTLLWVGDAETGDLSQFQDTPWNDVGGTRPQATTDQARDGRFSIRLGINGTTGSSDGICCGSRNELLPRFRDLVPGDDLWFGFSTFLGQGFPVDANWQVITQFKQNFDGSPPLSLNVEDGQYKIEGGYGHPDGPRPFLQLVGPAVAQQWVDWVLHVKFSADPAVGFVEVWKDGTPALPRYAPATGTLYPGPKGIDSSYVKTGYYRDPTISRPGTIYLDDWRIGTSMASVQR